MAKHTPGPWRMSGREVVGLKEKIICEVPSYGILRGKVDDANARLIAAAPDLLAACKMAAGIIARLATGESGVPKVLSDAIAKATESV